MDEKINELIYEIRSLVNTLGSGGQSSKTPQTDTSSGTSADASTKRLIAALGMLASKIENTTSRVKKTAEEQAASAKEFSKSVDALSDSMDAAAKKIKDEADAYADEQARNTETARRARLSHDEILQEQKAAAKKARQASNTEILENARSSGQISKGQAKFGQILSKAGIPLGRSSKDLASNASTLSAGLNLASAGFGGLTKSMQILGKGFRNNTLDAGGVAEGVGSFVTSITGVTKYMGRYGFAISLAIDGLVKFGIAAAKQGSAQANVFNDLAKSGANTTSGLNGIMHTLHDFNLVTKDAAKVTALISSSAPNLALFSTGVSGGVKAMAGLSKEIGSSGLRKEFKLLGYDTDAQRESQFRYMRVMSASGALQMSDSKKLAAGAAEYLKHQDRLTRATGISADAQEAARMEALQQEQFQIRQFRLNQGTDEDKEQAKKELANFDAINATLGKNTALAYAASLDGFFNEANVGFAKLGVDILGIAQDKTSSPDQIVKKLVDPLRDSIVNGPLGTQMKFGKGQELLGFNPSDLVKNLSATDPQARLIAAKKEQEDLVGPKADPGVKAAVETSENTLKTAKRMEAAVQLGVDGMQKFGSALTGLGERISRILPGKTEKGDSTTEKIIDYADKIVDEALNPFGGLIKMLRGQGFADGGIAQGPGSGHLQLLHGTEAVIPLKGGGVPVQLSGGGGMDAGPVFNPQTETNYLIEKSNEELVKSNVTLSQILEAITGGATVTGGGGGTSEQVAQEALAEHDHAHPHEPAAAADPELAKQIGKIVNPLEKMNQTSGFMRNDGKTGHGAIDLAGKIGDKVMAPISGMARVLSEKESGGYGNMVEVTDEKTGVKHMLAHLDKSMVKTGEMIKAGQQIGTLGNTGKSTGAHLHHEMRDKFGKKIDPSQFYSGPGFGSTAGGAATGNPNIARQGRRAGATQYPGPGAAPGMGDGLGSMSEKYETGGRGSGTVGYDKVGGTSYGKYQIASKVGAMKDFLKFAEQSGRGDVAKKLRDAGAETDTGGTSGKSVDVWKQMAAGGELGDLEHQFIKKKSFDPAMSGLKDDDLRKKIEGNKALKEMMWSTSVQHGGGGAAGIMNKVYKKGMSDEDLIKATYAERGTRFGGSTAEVQKGVKNRFVSEEKDVMAMLGMPASKGVPGATMVAGAEAGPRTTGSLKSALGLPEGGAGAGTGGLMGMLGGMLGGGTTAPAGGGGLMGMLGSILGGGATAPGQPEMAGVTAGGAPGAIGSDISAITQAMEAQTAATQTAITSGMENLTTQLVDKLGGAGGTNDPAVPTLLGEILAAQRDQTTAINKLIQVSTA